MIGGWLGWALGAVCLGACWLRLAWRTARGGRPGRRVADPSAIKALEQELGMYQPTGDNLFECPRCGKVTVMSTTPEPGFAYLCAPCSMEVLVATGTRLDEAWRAKLWECCRACSMGCGHSLWRREAGRMWSVAEQRRRKAARAAAERAQA